MSTRVLFVDDDAGMTALVVAAMPRWNLEVDPCASAAEALERVARREYAAVVTDLKMRGLDGIGLCARLVENRPDIPVLVVTAFGSLETAVAAMRAGAYDFLTKPLEMAELAFALQRAIEHRAVRDEVHRLRLEVGASRPGAIFGRSPVMLQLFRMLDRLEDSEATVLIQGETGTGKELVARELHRRSRRARGPFVALSCAAVPAALLEAELFGHARGAFTGAVSSRVGLLRRAEKGTLFLDEVGELPLDLQGKLLRTLQERRVRPVGAEEEVPIDVRLLSATNRDLAAAVRAGEFREDLFFRLNVVRIDVPPLRARDNDVLLLAQHFLERYATEAGREVRGLTAETARRLLEHDWPGNVRELQNCLERAVALTEHDRVVVEDLPSELRTRPSSAPPRRPEDEGALLPLAEVERRHVLRVLEAVEGRRQEAARILGLDRKTLYLKLKRYQVQSDP